MSKLSKALRKGASWLTKRDPLSKALAKVDVLPGSVGAQLRGLSKGASTNPFNLKGPNIYDYAGLGAAAENEDVLKIGRMAGMALAVYFAAPAIAGALGSGGGAAGAGGAAQNTAGAVAGSSAVGGSTQALGTGRSTSAAGAAGISSAAQGASGISAGMAGGTSLTPGFFAAEGAMPAAALSAPAAASMPAARSGLLGMSAADVGQLVLLGATLAGTQGAPETSAPEPIPTREDVAGQQPDLTGLTAQQKRRRQTAGRSGTILTGPRGLGEVTNGNICRRTLLGY